jgi:hypothetical protein
MVLQAQWKNEVQETSSICYPPRFNITSINIPTILAFHSLSTADCYFRLAFGTDAKKIAVITSPAV